ncbi:AAA family ATPase [Wohlfahrtiimonas chitiniclastica]|uniref:AAA family ATPase n=1 Tax=Wohlfahrtiimonas chitiniclastica TaxID=400946 RepID=UPI000B9924D0|nr:AAA family ATPase [Wohlfahrtiimonas chitiniclastica]OYQ76027.1 hypothetical protein B9T18_01345 [Wohlfahrtiimonas chitiniclastica]
MIFTRVKIDNLFCFKDTEISFTYPKKNPDSIIEHEYLMGAENFRFKRLCIISGANASGKSSFAKILRLLVNIVHTGRRVAESSSILNASDENKPVLIDFDFVHPSKTMLTFKSLSLEFNNGIAKFRYAEAPIGKNDSVEKCEEKIHKLFQSKKSRGAHIYLDNYSDDSYHNKWDILETLLKKELIDNSIPMIWNTIISDIMDSSKHDINGNDSNYKNRLLMILQTFDPSINKIEETFVINEKKKKEVTGYRIYFQNGKYCAINENGVVNHEYKFLLSQGTYQGISVAGFIHHIATDKHASGTFFLDEKMSNSHTEIEREVVNLIAQIINVNSQFFYTTHNYDVLDMGFPLHSFVFIKKNNEGSEFVWADTVCNKNDRSLIPYVKANYFGTLPCTQMIDRILNE